MYFDQENIPNKDFNHCHKLFVQMLNADMEMNDFDRFGMRINNIWLNLAIFSFY